MNLINAYPDTAIVYVDGKAMYLPPGEIMDLGTNTSCIVTGKAYYGAQVTMKGVNITTEERNVTLLQVSGDPGWLYPGWLGWSDDSFNSFQLGFQFGSSLLGVVILIYLVRKLMLVTGESD